MSFELISETAGDPNRPIQGPFLLRGSNLQYDSASSEISVDLVVVNQGTATLPEPVTVTFVALQPAGVSVANPDNDESGAGAMITFEFANNDGMWAPDEESLARTVRFGVRTAASVGFSARIDVGASATGGSIGGIVWNDVDRDGVLDVDERGVGGVRLTLFADQVPTSGALRETTTATDGSYRFDGLPAGFYRVIKNAKAGLQPTTETTFHVLLIEEAGGVHDFLMANFGCVRVVEPDVSIDISDYVEVKGNYLDDPPRIVATEVEVEKCPSRETWQVPLTADDDCEDWGELRGTVTDVDTIQRSVQINGTWLRFPTGYEGNSLLKGMPAGATAVSGDDDDHDLRPEDVQVGQRVRARARQEQGELLGFRLRLWNGSGERIRGVVEQVQRNQEGALIGLRLLDTDVVIHPGTRIE